jgi:GNAT superfamily N-acetyltransferase
MSAGLPPLRRAGPADAEAVRKLTRDVYAKWVPAIGREPKPMSANYGEAVVRHWIDVLEDAQGLLALIELIPAADHLLIENLAVREDQQGRGLGAMLIAHAERLAAALNLAELRLYTNAAFSSNLAYYRARGFTETARTPLPDGGTMVHFAKPVS